MDRSSEGRGRTLTRVDHRDARASVAAPAILIGALVIVGTFLDWASGTVIDATGTQTETVDLSGLNSRRPHRDGNRSCPPCDGHLDVGEQEGRSWFDADLLGVALSTIAIGTIVAF